MLDTEVHKSQNWTLNLEIGILAKDLESWISFQEICLQLSTFWYCKTTMCSKRRRTMASLTQEVHVHYREHNLHWSQGFCKSIKQDPNKVQAIKCQNQCLEDVWHFMSMANYLAKFVPQLATINTKLKEEKEKWEREKWVGFPLSLQVNWILKGF